MFATATGPGAPRGPSGRREAKDRAEEHGRAADAVVLRGPLGLVVAEPATGWHEDHARRIPVGHVLRVVPGAGPQPERRVPETPGGIGHRAQDARMERGRRT